MRIDFTRAAGRESEGGDMEGPTGAPAQRWTRAHALRVAAAGGAALVGGATIAATRDDGVSLAASDDLDAKIINLFLRLERVQEAFYREALESGNASGELQEFITTTLDQEKDHVAFLTDWLGKRADAAPDTAFGRAVGSTASVQDTAIELEEATIAAYIAQTANLTRKTVAPITTLLSVEARQAAWVRDIAGRSPAPRAADPPRTPQAVLADFRKRGFVR